MNPDVLEAFRKIPAPEFRAGQGTPQALPYGQATQLNAQAQVAQQAQPQSPAVATAAPPPSETAASPAAGASPEPFKPQTPEDQFLFGQTQRPNEPVTAGMGRASPDIPPPDGWENDLPDLQRAALEHPEIPQIQMLLNLVMFHAQRTGVLS